MAGQQTTRLQVSGYRFLVRRMEHALVRGDTRMLDDPLRAQTLSLTAGAVLAVVAVAVCAAMAVVRPAGGLGDAPIVMVRESGALYVRVDDTLHPVLNLASARLLAGSTADPRLVSAQAVQAAKRGPQLGIPGAPAHLSPPLGPEQSAWTVCDDSDRETTVIAGQLDSAKLTAGQSVLVTPRGEGAAVTYLLHGGWRARVDLRHPAVVRALRLEGVTPRPVAPALLAAMPEAPAIAPPHIPGRGAPGPGVLRGNPVGSVVAVARAEAGAFDYFVVLADGVQRVGDVTADLIRFTDSIVGQTVPTVSADLIGGLPVVDTLAVATYPRVGGVSPDRVVCASWRRDSSEGASHTEVLTAGAVPAAPVHIARADADGPNIDAVSVPAGRCAYVRSVGLTGDGRSSGSLFLVSDSGVLYGIRDDDAAKRLGMPGVAEPAPWPVLALLPRGPELSREGASVLRDGFGAAP